MFKEFVGWVELVAIVTVCAVVGSTIVAFGALGIASLFIKVC